MSGYPDDTLGCGPCLFMTVFLTSLLIGSGYGLFKVIEYFVV